VILTNPPFGGEEEKSVQSNFPADKQTSETAWLFLQLVIRQLKDGGRCGIVVPNGMLFGDGVGARIKQQLLTECNLHTIVRLPRRRVRPLHRHPVEPAVLREDGPHQGDVVLRAPTPGGRKKYTKTKPIRYEEFADCQAWWTDRDGNEHAWRVPIADIEANGWGLDLRNPHGPEDLAHRPPVELLDELVKVEREILTLLESLQAELGPAS
jgi:type I restriction enzyme M protein